MSRRTAKILVITAGVLVMLWAVGAYYQRHNLASLAEAETKLDHADPAIRLMAAQRILLIAPTRTDVRFIKAEAQIERGDFGEARQTLEWLFAHDQTLSQAERRRAYRLLIESYLDGALRMVNSASRSASDYIAEHVEPLLQEAREAHAAFAALPGVGTDAMLLDAMHIDVTASLNRLKLAKARLELAKMEGVSFEDEIDTYAVQVTELTESVARLDQRQIELCRRIIEAEPGNLAARRLLFRLRLNRGEIDLARAEAEALAALPQLSYAAAGEVADRLLNLDRLYAQPTTHNDVALARSLIEHGDLTGVPELNYMLARTDLALRDDEAELAEQLALEIRTDSRYRDNLRATCLWALALARQGRAGEAAQKMQKVNETMRSAEARYTLGVVLDAMGNTPVAREQWLDAIEFDPMNITAHLAMATSLAEAGYVVEAERYILGARQCNEHHPRALALYARMVMEKPDPQALIDLVEEHAARSPQGVTWHDAALAAAMVLDDAARVRALAEARLDADPEHILAILARASCETPAGARYEAAALVARAMRDLVDDDPMRWPGPPPSEVLRWLPERIDRYAIHDDRPHIDFQPVFDAYFVHWSHEVALELLDAAIERWSNEPLLYELAAELALWMDHPDVARQRLLRHGELALEQTPTVAAMRAYLDVPIGVDSPTLDQMVLADRPTLLWIRMADALRRGDDDTAGRAVMALLTQSPWAEPALLYAMRDAHVRGRDDVARQWLDQARQRNATMAVLSECRLLLAQGKPDDARQLLDELIRRDPKSSERRYHAADIIARSNILADRATLAESAFETLVYSTDIEKRMVAVWATDVRLSLHSFNGAAAMLGAALRRPDIPPRWLDRMLVRARRVMDDESFESMLKMRLRLREPDAVVSLYQVEFLASRDLPAAEAALRELAKAHPDAPRLLMLKARLAAAQGRVDEAKAIYRRLAVSNAPTTALAAQAALDAMQQPDEVHADPVQGASR